MLAKVYSYGLIGLDAYLVTIEVDVSNGLPSTKIVGLPDNSIKESKERVRSAIKNSGHHYGLSRITVNLSPADTKKEGPSFDLAMAAGILAASNQLSLEHLNDYILLGELSLDGSLLPVSGTLPVALSINPQEFKGVIVPKVNAPTTALACDIKVFPFDNLNQVVQFLENPDPTCQFSNTQDQRPPEVFNGLDFSDVKGQLHVKRALEIAAAGAHNAILIGPPGSGKSMLAKRMVTILPDMSKEEAIETTKIYSAMGLLDQNRHMVRRRPFRSPHHTSSDAAIVGGGTYPRPGEVTLSHNGVLFLDEIPEFNRNVLESLRQPLEDQCVTISRAARSIQFPSKFMLVAAMNPCPCGFFTEPKKECRCSPNQIHKYISKISGPLLDRIDLHIEVPSLPSHDLLKHSAAEPSSHIKERTVKAREIQKARFTGTTIYANSQMDQKQIKKHCPLTDECRDLLKTAVDELNFSARAYDKILKVARTIADLDEKEEVLPCHIAEAIQYRCLDRDWWR